jgi:hypothetical protein
VPGGWRDEQESRLHRAGIARDLRPHLKGCAASSPRCTRMTMPAGAIERRRASSSNQPRPHRPTRKLDGWPPLPPEIAPRYGARTRHVSGMDQDETPRVLGCGGSTASPGGWDAFATGGEGGCLPGLTTSYSRRAWDVANPQTFCRGHAGRSRQVERQAPRRDDARRSPETPAGIGAHLRPRGVRQGDARGAGISWGKNLAPAGNARSGRRLRPPRFRGRESRPAGLSSRRGAGLQGFPALLMSCSETRRRGRQPDAPFGVLLRGMGAPHWSRGWTSGARPRRARNPQAKPACAKSARWEREPNASSSGCYRS